MKEITAKVLDNKNLTLSSNNFGNKKDNSIYKVRYDEISENGNLNNKYTAFCSPSGEIFLFPLLEDNSFIITTSITKEAGQWSMVYLSTNTEIKEDGSIDNNYKVYVSNSVSFNITDNFLDDSIEDVIVDENLKIIYERLEQTIIYLNSDSFKNDLLATFTLTDTDINKITNNLKNDEEFKQEVKGEDGEKGADGKDGKDGKDGIGIYQEWINSNSFKIGDLSNAGTYYYWNKNIIKNLLSSGSKYNGQVVFENTFFSYVYYAPDRVFNIYALPNRDIRVGWITLDNILNGSDYRLYNNTDNNIVVLELFENTMLRKDFLYIEDYTDLYMKGERGDKGEQGIQGERGDKGEQGIQGEKGKDGEQGEKGKDGYTPVIGTDYWTEQDKQEIKNYCKNYIDIDILGGAS